MVELSLCPLDQALIQPGSSPRLFLLVVRQLFQEQTPLIYRIRYPHSVTPSNECFSRPSGRGRFLNLRAGALRAGWERGHFRGGDRHRQPFSFTLKNFSPLEIVKLIFWHLPSKIFMGETPQQPACSPGADRSLCWAEVHHQPFSPLPSKIYLAGRARPSPRGWDQQKILRLRGGRVGVPTTGRKDGSAQSRLPATR